MVRLEKSSIPVKSVICFPPIFKLITALILAVVTNPSRTPLSIPKSINASSKLVSGIAVVWAIIILDNEIINKIYSIVFIIMILYVCQCT